MTVEALRAARRARVRDALERANAKTQLLVRQREGGSVQPPQAEDEAFLRTLIDLTWGEAMEDNSVPSASTQTRLIERARAAMEASRVR